MYHNFNLIRPGFVIYSLGAWAGPDSLYWWFFWYLTKANHLDAKFFSDRISTLSPSSTVCATYVKTSNIKIASSTEIAASWNFSCVCGLPLCWCWWFFILRQKLFLARKLAKQNVFAMGSWKIVSISIKAHTHAHRKNLRLQQLLWTIEGITDRVHTSGADTSCLCTVTEEPAEFHA